ncbi:hypothetical protein ACTTAI_13160 [Rhodobacter capsulatus]|uniref:hypothetical protein n=1 Tax=Rhodobacter capsulatus TaxID=1061 RepID=UPI004026042E
MMRSLDRLRRSVALMICPELAALHDGGTVQGALSLPVGANATEEAAKALCVVPAPKWTGAPVPKPARKDGFVGRAAERARRQKDMAEMFAVTPEELAIRRDRRIERAKKILQIVQHVQLHGLPGERDPAFEAVAQDLEILLFGKA